MGKAAGKEKVDGLYARFNELRARRKAEPLDALLADVAKRGPRDLLDDCGWLYDLLSVFYAAFHNTPEVVIAELADIPDDFHETLNAIWQSLRLAAVARKLDMRHLGAIVALIPARWRELRAGGTTPVVVRQYALQTDSDTFNANFIPAVGELDALRDALAVEAAAGAGAEPPIDLSAYVPASKIVTEHAEGIEGLTLKRLKGILDGNREIRRYKPSEKRLLIHAGDWLKYAAKQAGELNEAIADAAASRKAKLDQARKAAFEQSREAAIRRLKQHER